MTHEIDTSDLVEDADLLTKFRDIEKSVLYISRVEPREVNGNVHPRYMVALDRIRLTDAVNRAKRESLLSLFAGKV